MAAAQFALALCALLAFSPLVSAHYNMKYPKPYNPIDCNPPDCRGPCPPIWRRGKAAARNSPSRPAAIWRRGQVVDIEWHRNNHEGGYYRRSLVPVKYMNDKKWHKKTAFDWGCWTQGRFYCGKKKECGTDERGFGYRNKMTVPSVFPDGDYVFAMVWYGGIHWQRKRAFFSDYYTCAYVKIQGGNRLVNRHKPTFTPGKNHRDNVPAGKCVSAKQFIGECGGEECKGRRAITTVPGVFTNGRTPPPVKLSDLNGGAVVPESQSESVLKIAPLEEERRALEKVKEEERVDAALVSEQMKAEADPLTQRKGAGGKSTRSTPEKTVNMMSLTNMDGGLEVWRGMVVPQWPTGHWGPTHSQLYRSQLAKWRKRMNFCNRYKEYPNCTDGIDGKKSNSKRNSNSKSNSSFRYNKKVTMWRGKPVPQWPTGPWGPEGSALYESQRAKWWKRMNFCNRNKDFPNCKKGM